MTNSPETESVPILSNKGHLSGTLIPNSLVNLIQNHNYFNATFTVENFAKIYPKSYKIFEVKHSFQKLRPGWHINSEYGENQPRNPLSKLDRAIKDYNNKARSFRRSKTKVVDLAICNEFDWFVLFTLDPKLYDITDKALCKKVIENWLHNQKRIWGSFEYLAVPELTKKGAIHFHLLFKGYKGRMVYSGHKDRAGRKKYNLPGYRAGIIANATRIESFEKSCAYLSKYISKDLPALYGKKRYWRSKGLLKPSIVYNTEHIYTKEKPQNLYQTPMYLIYDIPRTDNISALNNSEHIFNMLKSPT